MSEVATIEQPAVLPAPPPRYWALWHAVVAERDRRVRRAVLVSSLAGLLAVFAFGASILPGAVAANLVMTYLLYLLVQGVVLGLILLRDTGGTYRQAQVVGELARRASYQDWKEKTGEDAPPFTPEAAAGWLARHPDDDDLLPQRLHAQLNVGDLADARRTLARYPRETPEQRYGHASDAWFLDFLEGSDASPDGLDSLAVEIDDPVQRARAIAGSATMRAYPAAVHGRDWVTPMAAPYPIVADLITDDWRAPIVIRTWTMTMAITSALVGAAMLVAGWMGILRV